MFFSHNPQLLFWVGSTFFSFIKHHYKLKCRSNAKDWYGKETNSVFAHQNCNEKVWAKTVSESWVNSNWKAHNKNVLNEPSNQMTMEPNAELSNGHHHNKRNASETPQHCRLGKHRSSVDRALLVARLAVSDPKKRKRGRKRRQWSSETEEEVDKQMR